MTRYLILLALCQSLFGATYYVAKTGNDTTGNGSFGNPWLTIGKAAASVSPEDIVYVRAGTYAEYVTLTIDGTESKPITWIGEGSWGNWTTIIDPSVDLSTGWVLAPEVGSGVYKNTGAAFRVGALFANGRAVGESISSLDRLATGANDLRTTLQGYSYPFWNGMEALFHDNGAGTVYLRFRNGDNPNGKTIRVSQFGTRYSDATVTMAPIKVSADYQIIRGFHIRGGYIPVLVTLNNGTVRGTQIVLNKIEHGKYGIAVVGQDYFANSRTYRTTIISNYIHQNMWAEGVGATNGAWHENFTAYPTTSTNFGAYQLSKWLWTMGVSESKGITFSSADGSGSDSNVVCWNVVSNNAGGITMQHYPQMVRVPPAPVQYEIASNSFYNISDAAIMPWWAVDQTRIHDNLLINVTSAFREGSVNQNRSGQQSRAYIYRNRVYNPPYEGSTSYSRSLGDNYLHSGTGTFQTERWYYHNTFDGLRNVIQLGALSSSTDCLKKFYWINNIAYADDTLGSETVFATTSFGRWDYNWVRQASTADMARSWWGSGNIVSAATEWGSGTSRPTSIPSFLIDEESLAWNAGTNLASLSLPDTRTVDSGVWDIGWHEYSTTAQKPPTYLSVGAAQVFEGSSTYIRITRSGTTSGALSGTIAYSGTAVDGVNYTAPSTSWTIDNGQSYEDLTLATLQDGERTGNLTVIATLQSGSGYTVAGGPVTVTIVDTTVNTQVETKPKLPGTARPYRL